MRVVIQRVSQASVSIDGQVHGKIGRGLLVLLAIEVGEDGSDMDWLVQKIVNLRIFNDANGVMNLSLQETNAEVLIVSQFTLFAKTKKGNRPSYIDSAKPDVAIPIYNRFVESMAAAVGHDVPTGIFGADMQVSLVNDGPVTIIIDSKRRE